LKAVVEAWAVFGFVGGAGDGASEFGVEVAEEGGYYG